MPAVIPIPGATTVARVTENSRPVELDDSDLDEINATLESFQAAGRRYPEGTPTET